MDPQHHHQQDVITENNMGTASGVKDDSVGRRANTFKRLSNEPLSDKMGEANASKGGKVATIKNPNVQNKRKKDLNEQEKAASAIALLFRDTQARDVNYMQQHHYQPKYRINDSNINQDQLQHQPIDIRNRLMTSHSYQMQQQKQQHPQSMKHNSHPQQTNSHHATGGGDQLTNLEKCTRNGCTNQAKTSSDWEDEYCSNECAVKHCADVFGNWIRKNGQQQQSYSAFK